MKLVIFIIGVFIGGAIIGIKWKAAVTSGDYFEISNIYYSCNKHKIEFK